MKDWLEFISIIASFVTFIGFIAIFVKLGKEKGASEVYQKEMRKDIESNENKIVKLENDITQMKIENTKLTSTLFSDLSWIKASLTEIKDSINKKEEK